MRLGAADCSVRRADPGSGGAAMVTDESDFFLGIRGGGEERETVWLIRAVARLERAHAVRLCTCSHA